MLLRVRSHFRIISISSSTDLNNNKKNNKAQGCAFNAELEKKINSSLFFGQAALTFGLFKAISCLSKVYYDFVRG